MKKIVFAAFIFLLVGVAGLSLSLDAGAQTETDYAGQEKREIKSLSASDIEELQKGRGWGLAKAAELNGFPGPVHLLELKDEIKLSSGQISQINSLYSQMKEKAVPLGVKLIGLEKQMDEAFANKTINETDLAELLAKIETVRKDLRYVHLSVHLKTPSILTPQQIAKYNELRGYSSKDPCANVPEGHDPSMWKKHNGCGP